MYGQFGIIIIFDLERTNARLVTNTVLIFHTVVKSQDVILGICEQARLWFLFPLLLR